MDNQFDLPMFDGKERIVYLREVAADQLPDELRAEMGEQDSLFAVFNGEGEQLAFVTDVQTAKQLGREFHVQVHTLQ